MSAPLSNASRDWLRWLDRIPLLALVVAAVLLGPAPFVPEPHVWEKLKMLAAGTLIRPIDIFDLLWHAAPLVLLGMKLMRGVLYKNTNKNN